MRFVPETVYYDLPEESSGDNFTVSDGNHKVDTNHELQRFFPSDAVECVLPNEPSVLTRDSKEALAALLSLYWLQHNVEHSA